MEGDLETGGGLRGAATGLATGSATGVARLQAARRGRIATIWNFMLSGVGEGGFGLLRV